MKIGTIIRPNQKGQIVIPTKIRKTLGITPSVALNIVLSGGGIYIHPVVEVITKERHENSYVDILQKTQGAWKDEDWGLIRNKRSSKELTASKKRKKSW